MFQVPNQMLKPNTYYIFNHLEFTIIYHSSKNEQWGSSFSSEGGRIIGNIAFNLCYLCCFIKHY